MSTLPHFPQIALAAALAISCGGAWAQQHDHSSMQMQDMPGMDMSSMQDTSKQHDATRPASKNQTKPPADGADPHAGHHGLTMPMDHGRHAPTNEKKQDTPGKSRPKSGSAKPDKAVPASDRPSGQAMPAGMAMDMQNGAAMERAGHGEPAHPPAEALPPPTPEALAAAFQDLGGMDMASHMDDNPTVAVFRGDRLEHADGRNAWDARLGIGGNFDKFWLRSEGEHVRGEQARGDVQLQWSHATGPWWDRVLSLRSDFGPGPSRQWAGIGVTGLAPYKFELEAHAYIGEQGRLAARFEGEYALLLTNRLILTPRVELNAYGKEDRSNRIGQGLSTGEAGLRLRYEFTRQFAPYVGYAWSRSFGNTADLARAQDEPVLDHGWVAGLRFWF